MCIVKLWASVQLIWNIVPSSKISVHPSKFISRLFIIPFFDTYWYLWGRIIMETDRGKSSLSHSISITTPNSGSEYRGNCQLLFREVGLAIFQTRFLAEALWEYQQGVGLYWTVVRLVFTNSRIWWHHGRTFLPLSLLLWTICIADLLSS